MEFRQLRHFLVLAEESHYGRAAERLCISQPALSASIQRLEEELGLRLFDRDNKSVQITRAGELMLGCAREIVNNADRTMSFARAISSGSMSRLELAFSSLVLDHRLEQILKQFRSDMPDVEIVMHEVTSQSQLELLRSGRFDAGLVNFPLPPNDFSYLELHSDRYVACLPEDHPLARQDTIDVAALRNEFFILPARTYAPSVYDQLLGLCAMAGFRPRISFQTGHSLSTLNLVSRGMGVSIVFESVRHFGHPGVVFVPLQKEQPARHGYFIWNNHAEAPALRLFIERLKQTFQPAGLIPPRAEMNPLAKSAPAPATNSAATPTPPKWLTPAQ